FYSISHTHPPTLFPYTTLFRSYFGKYEFTAKYLLSSSDAESRSIRELLDLEPGAYERFLDHWCGYTESPGSRSSSSRMLRDSARSEEHTSELQSRGHLVCRLLL